MRLPRFYGSAALSLAACLLQIACFGDNSGDESDGANSDGPSVVEIVSPDEVDQGDAIDVTIKVKGSPDEQLSVAADATLGAFSPQNKIVIANVDGEGTFVTRYTPGTAGGAEILTANVSSLAGISKSATKALTVYSLERFGNVTQVGPASAHSAGVLVAYPIVLATDRVVRKLGVLSPVQTPAGMVDVQLGLYATDTATSVNVLTKTTAKLVAGANEITIPAQALTAGTYWMVVAYDGTPMIYRSATERIVLRYKLNHIFSGGLADKLDGLITSQPTDYFTRNFYLVLRK
jgi:hypothetical protein